MIFYLPLVFLKLQSQLDVSDLNGDGKSDIIRYYFTVKDSTNGSTYTSYTPEIHVNAYLNHGEIFENQDITDLFDELTFHTYAYFGPPDDSIGSNLIEGRFIPQSLSCIDYDHYPRTFYLNYNGTGNGAILIEHTNDNGTIKRKLISLVTGGRQRLVTSVLSGMNFNTSFTYNTLYNDTVYSRSSQGTFPVFNFLSPLYVVREEILWTTWGLKIFQKETLLKRIKVV